ncbi:TIGR00645 family protein [Alphaproteobacteria bacterium]|jgi:uncharacterized protein (TIGR00645 family)|nr:TIGR00645 family protein [Alphaproteobacteria bacterium]
MEKVLESLIFKARWLMAPFYLGLALSLVVLLIVFINEFVHFFTGGVRFDETSIILLVLTLIDLSFTGNLLIMVIFSGYENFVSKIDVGHHEDKPKWMGTVDFSGLKLKLISSIVAISGIQLLKIFFDLKDYTKEEIYLFIAVHVTFVISGVLLALMDYIASKVKH